MKKLLLITAFALISLGSHAQKADEEAIRKLGIAEKQATLDRDLTAWLSCFAQTPDMAFGFSPAIPTYILHGYDELAKFGKGSVTRYPNRSSDTFVHSDHHFRIRGNTGMVTYLATTTSPDGSQRRSHEVNYVEKENGVWKIVGHFYSVEPQPTDEETIKKVCNDHTDAWIRRDTPGLLAFNAPVPYSSRYWATETAGVGAINGDDTIKKVYTDFISKSPQPTNTTTVQSNWQLKPLGENYYWATYDQVSTYADGKISRNKEARLLEKIGGQWKMVSVITLPSPKN